MKSGSDVAKADNSREVSEPAWRQRAVSRSLSAARSRAEQRVQRFLDAALDLIDEKGTTDFTIQEVVDRSKQSLRGFYQYFDGKDELLLALFEETCRECIEDIRKLLEPPPDLRVLPAARRRPSRAPAIGDGTDHAPAGRAARIRRCGGRDQGQRDAA